MRKQDEPLFDQDGSILMNDEGKKPCREDTVGTAWLKAPHQAFGRSIFAQKLPDSAGAPSVRRKELLFFCVLWRNKAS